MVLSRAATPITGVEVITDLAALSGLLPDGGELWICGGAEIYALTLSWWDELLITRVKRTVAGDAFFPKFEHLMILSEVVREAREFTIERYVTVG